MAQKNISNNSLNTELPTSDRRSPEININSSKWKNLIVKIMGFIKIILPFSWILWIVVLFLVVSPLFGYFLIKNSLNYKVDVPSNNQKTILVEKQFHSGIDAAIISAVREARIASEKQASEELNRGEAQLMTRVDNNFIPWYFDYFNQKGRELNSIWTGLSSELIHLVNSQGKTGKQAIKEQLIEEFQLEFSNRVLRPQAAQMQLKRIAENTVDLYINRIVENLGTVKVKYQIPEADWESYTNEIAITIFGTNGSATKRIQKEMMLGTTGIIMAKALLPTVGKISSKVVVSLASKVGAKTATKTGALVAGKLGAQLIDPIAAVGIIAWDIWDYNHSVDVEKPILRQAVAEYLDEVKYSLLDNHENENSIMSCIYQVEDKILNSLEFKG